MTETSEEERADRVTLELKEGRALFGQAPDAYLRSRPKYPKELYDAVFAHLRHRPPVTVEVGPGPGLATRELLNRGLASLAAVEPDPRLAALLRQTFVEFALEVIEAPFESALLPTGAFDLCVAATSFHWVNPQMGYRQVCRILRHGGIFACFWTIFEPQDDAFQIAARTLPWGRLPTFSTETSATTPFALNAEARRSEMEQAGLEVFEVRDFESEEVFDPERLAELYASFSIVRAAEPEVRHQILEGVFRLARDKFGGEVRRLFQTRLYLARRP